MSPTAKNTLVLEQDFAWPQIIIQRRISNFLNRDDPGYLEQDTNPVQLEISFVIFCVNFVPNYNLNTDERNAMLLALTPKVKPELLDPFLIRNANYDKIYTGFGMIQPRFICKNSLPGFAKSVCGEILISELQLGNNIQPGYRALFHGSPGIEKNFLCFSRFIFIKESMSKCMRRICKIQIYTALLTGCLIYAEPGKNLLMLIHQIFQCLSSKCPG